MRLSSRALLVANARLWSSARSEGYLVLFFASLLFFCGESRSSRVGRGGGGCPRQHYGCRLSDGPTFPPPWCCELTYHLRRDRLTVIYATAPSQQSLLDPCPRMRSSSKYARNAWHILGLDFMTPGGPRQKIVLVD